MNRLLRRRAVRGATVAALAGLVTAVVVATTPALASAGTTLTVRYPVNGSTFLKAANATVPLGPGTLRTKVNLTTGKVTASLNLPPATGSFKELGVIPVTATVAFIQDGPTTGTVDLNTGAVTTMSNITLQITSLSVGGLPTAETYAAPYLEMGVTTYSSAIFNFAPQWALDFYTAVRARDTATVYRKLDEFVLPYIEIRDRRAGYAVAIVKAGLRAVGYDPGPVRPPLTDLTDSEFGELKALVEKVNLT